MAMVMKLALLLLTACCVMLNLLLLDRQQQQLSELNELQTIIANCFGKLGDMLDAYGERERNLVMTAKGQKLGFP